MYKFAIQKRGYELGIFNAAIFLFLSSTMSILGIQEKILLVAAPLMYFFLSAYIFIILMSEGRSLEPLAWFVLGSGVFFGFGISFGAVRSSGGVSNIFTDNINFLDSINLVNSISIFLVLVISALICNPRKKNTKHLALPRINFIDPILSIFPYIIFVSAINLLMRYYYFPLVQDLVLRSFLDKLNFVYPAVFLVFGMLYGKLTWFVKIIAFMMMIMAIISGLLLLNKYEVMVPVLAFLIGLWTYIHKKKFVILSLSIPIICFLILNPLISIGREHPLYNAYSNTISQRIDILGDVVSNPFLNSVNIFDSSVASKFDLTVKERVATQAQIVAAAGRFNIFDIESYLIKEYQEGHSGNTIERFWVALIPRAFWSSKPIITANGSKLSVDYYNDSGQGSSSMAPSYTGEAYWNGGYLMVIIISMYLGVIFGLSSKMAGYKNLANNPAYLMVAFQLILSAVFLESWFVATYIGGVMTALCLFLIFYFGYASLKRNTLQ